MNHAIVNPPLDRHKPAEQSKDVFVCVQKEVDGGIIVSGAKVVATSAAMTHYNFMGQSSKTATEDLDMSLMFLVPIDAPARSCSAAPLMSKPLGITAHSTIHYHPASTKTMRSLFWTKYLSPGKTSLSTETQLGYCVFYPRSGFTNGFQFQGCTRLPSNSILSPACWRKPCAAPVETRREATRCCWGRSSPGETSSGRCRTPWRTIRARGMAMRCFRT